MLRLVRRYSNAPYKTTIDKLNSLQSNAATINALRASGQMNQNAIPEMRDWLNKAGVSQDDINDLRIIHVAGTKGKGSTCAMIASILQKYKLAYGRTPRIGLYTSPHLVSVRERIQIDGQPLPEEEWTEYFNQIWDTLPSKPVYFRFLTILAFHTFIQECVDVVVMECGVGGEHDSTNVIMNPVATGVTSLGIDHIHVLGSTIESIAWHKAGIFKPGVPAFTVPQPASALQVLQQRAKEIGTTLTVVEEHPSLSSMKLGIPGSFQKSNASLAIALANAYLQTHGVDENLSSLPAEFKRGLEEVSWPGRCETRVVNGREWCLDGAHTLESMALTMEWYNSLPEKSHALVFNQSSRDAVALLKVVHESTPSFDKVIFCTNRTTSEELKSVATQNDLSLQNELADYWYELRGQRAIVAETVEEAISSVYEDRVLVTGSLHLVGAVMTVLG